MFKLTISETDHFSSERKYYTLRQVSFGKSPKECHSKMSGHNHGQRTVTGGHPWGYGGTPVMREVCLEKDGKVVYRFWD